MPIGGYALRLELADMVTPHLHDLTGPCTICLAGASALPSTHPHVLSTACSVCAHLLDAHNLREQANAYYDQQLAEVVRLRDVQRAARQAYANLDLYLHGLITAYHTNPPDYSERLSEYFKLQRAYNDAIWAEYHAQELLDGAEVARKAAQETFDAASQAFLDGPHGSEQLASLAQALGLVE